MPALILPFPKQPHAHIGTIRDSAAALKELARMLDSAVQEETIALAAIFFVAKAMQNEIDVVLEAAIALDDVAD